MFRFVAAGLSIHLPEPFLFSLWLSHQHLRGTISRRFVARGPRTISRQPFPLVFFLELGVLPNTWHGASKRNYKLRTCQSTGRGPKDCACQSFGPGFRSGCSLGETGTHTNTCTHRPKSMHLPVYGPGPSKLFFLTSPSWVRPPGALPGRRGLTHTNSCNSLRVPLTLLIHGGQCIMPRQVPPHAAPVFPLRSKLSKAKQSEAKQSKTKLSKARQSLAKPKQS